MPFGIIKMRADKGVLVAPNDIILEVHRMKEVYVVNCCRTAVGSFGGSLKDTPAAEMGAVVIKEALNRAGVKPE